MWYIYELSYNKVPFYIGLSASPESRYYGHITSPQSKCYNLIRFNIKYFNIYPDINILDNTTCKYKIRDLERHYIKKALQSGIELLNFRDAKIDTVKLPKWRIIPADILNNLKNQINERK